MGLPDSDFELLRTTGELIYEYDGYTDGETMHLAGAELNRLLNKMRELASALAEARSDVAGLEAQGGPS